MYAIVLAGGVPDPEDPLYPYTQGIPKALLDIAGKPMIQWVLDALSGAETIEQVLVVGLPDSGELTCDKPVDFLPSQGDMLANILFGTKEVVRRASHVENALIASSDVPAIKPHIVDWVVRTAQETVHDIYYSVISRHVMEARFPGSKRSYTRLKDVDVCGGDVNVVRTLTVTGKDEMWNRIIAARKNVFKQASLLGYDLLLLLLLKQITLEGAVKKVSRRIDLRGRAVLCPYAEVGMDVDKPHQLELLRADLQKS